MKISNFSAGFGHLAAGLLLALALLACGGAQRPAQGSATTTLSFVDLDRAERGVELAEALEKEENVERASFDEQRAEITIVANRSFDALAEARALRGEEKWDLVLGAGKGRYVAWGGSPSGADVRVVSEGGADVPDLAKIIVPGKVTIVDFSASWCEPCRELDAYIMKTFVTQEGVAYRKLDVGDWNTPLAERYLIKKGVPEIPYVIVFDRQGREVDAMWGIDGARLKAAVARGLR